VRPLHERGSPEANVSALVQQPHAVCAHIRRQRGLVCEERRHGGRRTQTTAITDVEESGDGHVGGGGEANVDDDDDGDKRNGGGKEIDNVDVIVEQESVRATCSWQGETSIRASQDGEASVCASQNGGDDDDSDVRFCHGRCVWWPQRMGGVNDDDDVIIINKFYVVFSILVVAICRQRETQFRRRRRWQDRCLVELVSIDDERLCWRQYH
jgi:hypothetical protein